MNKVILFLLFFVSSCTAVNNVLRLKNKSYDDSIEDVRGLDVRKKRADKIYFIFERGFHNTKITIYENDIIVFKERLRSDEYGFAKEVSFDWELKNDSEMFIMVGFGKKHSLKIDSEKKVLYISFKNSRLKIKKSSFLYFTD